jgi:hypothetical protein
MPAEAQQQLPASGVERPSIEDGFRVGSSARAHGPTGAQVLVDKRDATPTPRCLEISHHLAFRAERLAGHRWRGMRPPHHPFLILAGLSSLPEPRFVEDSAQFCRTYTL